MGVVVPWGSLAQAPVAAHYLSARLMSHHDPVTRAVFATMTQIEPGPLDMPLASRRRLVRNVVDVMSPLCLAHVERHVPDRAGLGKADLVEFPDRSVALVAATWGLTNPAHFSQMFKAAFDVTPREYRVSSRAAYRAIQPVEQVA